MLHHHFVLTMQAILQDLSEDFRRLEHEFSVIGDKVKKDRRYSVPWTKGSRKLIKTALESTINSFVSKGTLGKLAVQEGKEEFTNLALTNLGTELAQSITPSISELEFNQLHTSLRNLLHSQDQKLDQSTIQGGTSRDVNDQSTQVAPPEAQPERNHSSTLLSQNMVGKDARRAVLAPDLPAFTISIGVPISANDQRFTISFNDELAVWNLTVMPVRELYQLVRDAIQYDEDIPNRATTLPWITDIQLLHDRCLDFQARTVNDLQTLTTNVTWVRAIQDTLSAPIKTYRVMLADAKVKMLKKGEFRDSASIIDSIRKQNSQEIPSLNTIGAIRDIIINDNYILIFGSREAANLTLDVGLWYRNRKRICLAFSPGKQWHEQCSHCKQHGHAARNCQSMSMPVCGKCGSNHATHVCTSVKSSCSNCYGEHSAFNKTCPAWLEAEERAQRSYRFPAQEGSEIQMGNPAPTAKEILQFPAAPLSLNIKPLEESPSASTLLQPTSQSQDLACSRPATDNKSSNKRSRLKAAQYLMSGALDIDDDSPKEKRIRIDESEDPVWPIGQEDTYQPPLARGA